MLTLIVSNGQQKGRVLYVIADTKATLGRSVKGPYRLPDSRISRKHARIELADDRHWTITDLESSNGTFVNGQRIALPARLQEGDQLQLGRLSLVVANIAKEHPHPQPETGPALNEQANTAVDQAAEVQPSEPSDNQSVAVVEQQPTEDNIADQLPPIELEPTTDEVTDVVAEQTAEESDVELADELDTQGDEDRTDDDLIVTESADEDDDDVLLPIPVSTETDDDAVAQAEPGTSETQAYEQALEPDEITAETDEPSISIEESGEDVPEQEDVTAQASDQLAQDADDVQADEPVDDDAVAALSAMQEDSELSDLAEAEHDAPADDAATVDIQEQVPVEAEDLTATVDRDNTQADLVDEPMASDGHEIDLATEDEALADLDEQGVDAPVDAVVAEEPDQQEALAQDAPSEPEEQSQADVPDTTPSVNPDAVTSTLVEDDQHENPLDQISFPVNIEPLEEEAVGDFVDDFVSQFSEQPAEETADDEPGDQTGDDVGQVVAGAATQPQESQLPADDVVDVDVADDAIRDAQVVEQNEPTVEADPVEIVAGHEDGLLDEAGEQQGSDDRAIEPTKHEEPADDADLESPAFARTVVEPSTVDESLPIHETPPSRRPSDRRHRPEPRRKAGGRRKLWVGAGTLVLLVVSAVGVALILQGQFGVPAIGFANWTGSAENNAPNPPVDHNSANQGTQTQGQDRTAANNSTVDDRQRLIARPVLPLSEFEADRSQSSNDTDPTPDQSPSADQSNPPTVDTSAQQPEPRPVTTDQTGTGETDIAIDDGPTLVGSTALDGRLRNPTAVQPDSGDNADNTQTTPDNTTSDQTDAATADTPNDPSDDIAMVDPSTLPIPDQIEPATPASDSGDVTEQQTKAAAAGKQPSVAFLVDASGSLVDTLPQVIEHLSFRIGKLSSKQTFTVIFFRKGQAIEVQPAGMRLATPEDRQLVRKWIAPWSGNVKTFGKSDPAKAIELALHYKVDQIYILSDDSFGRRLQTEQSESMADQLTRIIGEQPVQVHTIQFFYDDPDGVMQDIAEQFDGTYEFVAPSEMPKGSSTDLLSEIQSLP